MQAELNGLTGEGILVGIVDSGVDYFHPDFRNEDGSSRILRLWDQSVNGNPPESYVTGTEYTKEEIDKALALEETEGRRLVPSGISVDMVLQFLELQREMGEHQVE